MTSLGDLNKTKSNVLYDIGKCQLTVARGNIVHFEGDAIVNVTTEEVVPKELEDTLGIGVLAEIHKACGPKLKEACLELKAESENIRCPTGEARITDAFDLKTAKYIIHTVGPINFTDQDEARKLLTSCYTNCLNLALERQIKRIAFPLISCGISGFPVKEAAEIALDSITAVAKVDYPKEICFIMRPKSQFDTFEALAMKRFDPKKMKPAKVNPFITKGSTFRMSKGQKVMLGFKKKPVVAFQECEEEDEDSDSDSDAKKKE